LSIEQSIEHPCAWSTPSFFLMCTVWLDTVSYIPLQCQLPLPNTHSPYQYLRHRQNTWAATQEAKLDRSHEEILAASDSKSCAAPGCPLAKHIITHIYKFAEMWPSQQPQPGYPYQQRQHQHQPPPVAMPLHMPQHRFGYEPQPPMQPYQQQPYDMQHPSASIPPSPREEAGKDKDADYTNLPGPPPTCNEYQGYIYMLQWVQQPIRARMCGFGDKVSDRPAPIDSPQITGASSHNHLATQLLTVSGSTTHKSTALHSAHGNREGYRKGSRSKVGPRLSLRERN
jgi:hypothetical protein